MWPCLMMAAMTAVIVGLFPLGTDAAGPTVVAIDYRWSAQKCTTFRENFTTFPKNVQHFAKILQHFRKIYNVWRKFDISEKFTTFRELQHDCIVKKIVCTFSRKFCHLMSAKCLEMLHFFQENTCLLNHFKNNIILSKFCITSRNLMAFKGITFVSLPELVLLVTIFDNSLRVS